MTLILELPPDVERRLEEEAERQGIRAEELALFMIERAVDGTSSEEGVPPVHPVALLAQRIRQSLPEADWDSVPADLSMNLDHYLYGHPKATP